MTLQVIPQKEFIITSLVEFIHEAACQEEKSYSTSIEFGLSELARVNMRKIVQDSEQGYQPAEILSLSLELTKSQIVQKLQQVEIQFNFDKYVKNVQENLKFPAKEISKLSNKLAQSIANERIGDRVKIPSITLIPLEVTEIGLRDSIEGLLVTPLFENFAVNLDGIRNVYEVEGDWFPFKITVEELVFILDDDGTIFVFTENLPSRMVSEAKESIQILANQLYVRS
jgi:hypothetical protein